MVYGPEQLPRQLGAGQLISHQRCLRVRQRATHLPVAAATKGRLPQGGWVPQLPPHPLQMADDGHAAKAPPPQPQPQRRRPPLQRIATPQHSPPVSLPMPQQPQLLQGHSPAEHAQEYRQPPPHVPAAPPLHSAQQQRWPRLPYLIVVEGLSDKAAVTAATDSQVFVLRGAAHAMDSNTIDAVRRAAFGIQHGPQLHGIIVLMDPDDAGRRGRTALDGAFPGQCWHAFIPAADATAQLATRNHKAGNMGVEHAAPNTILRALATARLSQPERREFDREDLVALGLITEMGAQQAQTQGSAGNTSMAPVMRELVGRLLGIGLCDGKQLVRQLNRFDFTHHELATAVKLARGLLTERVRELREIRERRRQQAAAGAQ